MSVRAPRRPGLYGIEGVLRTGSFKLRLAALCRIVPIFFRHGKAPYQCFLLVYLSHLVRTTGEDMEALYDLLSTPWTKSPHARVGFGEQQEVLNTLYKGVTTEITRPIVSKPAALVAVRKHAQHETRRGFLVTAGG